MTVQGLEVEPKFRRETRAPLVAHIVVEYPGEETPESAYTSNVSVGGLFIQSSEPKPIGTSFRFELRVLSNGPAIRGFGEVRWVRKTDQGPGRPAGMGVQTGMIVDEQGQRTLRQAVAGAVKAGSLAGGPVPAPALHLSSAEAKEALARARGQETVSPAAKPQSVTETDELVLEAPEIEPVFRRATRALLVAPIVLEDPDDDAVVTGYTANLSVEGIFFQTTRPRPVGSHVTFELKIHGRGPTVRGIGTVRWVRAEDQGPGLPAGMGIQIIQLAGAQADKQLRQAIAGAVKASSVSSGAVPAPALPMSSPEAIKALARAHPAKAAAEPAVTKTAAARPVPVGEPQMPSAARPRPQTPVAAAEETEAVKPGPVEVEPVFRRATRALLVAPIGLEHAADRSTESAYTSNVSMGGLFVQSSTPRPVGSKLRFELKIRSDASPVKGFGEVRWIRIRDQGRGFPAGMGIRIDLLVGEEGQQLLRTSIAGAVKSSSVTKAPVPAPALPMSAPEAKEALARARLPRPGDDSSKPAVDDKVIRSKRERFKFGQHAERSSELKLKRMTEKAIKEGRKPKKFKLQKDDDEVEGVSKLERIRLRLNISKVGFLLIETLTGVSLILWLVDVVFL
jgi:Tfp pilus assembly protein PilZ